jgi:Domain of unknown function (DUF4277)
MKKQEIKTESLDHHGLVAAIAKELRIVERIDKHLGDKHELSFASIGQRVLAMIINLSFEFICLRIREFCG